MHRAPDYLRAPKKFLPAALRRHHIDIICDDSLYASSSVSHYQRSQDESTSLDLDLRTNLVDEEVRNSI